MPSNSEPPARLLRRFEAMHRDQEQSHPRRLFQSSLLRIQSDLRKYQAAKPVATIHFAKQAPKRKIGPFSIRLGVRTNSWMPRRPVRSPNVRQGNGRARAARPLGGHVRGPSPGTSAWATRRYEAGPGGPTRPRKRPDLQFEGMTNRKSSRLGLRTKSWTRRQA